MLHAPRAIFIINVIIVGILLVGLIRILATGGRYFFPLELAGFLVLAVLTAIAVAGFRRGWGNAVITGVLLLYLANLLLIWLFKGELYVVLLLLSLLGVLLGIASLTWKASPQEQTEAKAAGHGVQQPVPGASKTVQGISKSVSTTFTPGKYVASKTSNYYHAPTCEWAKKIMKSRQIWFQDKKEAWEKGLKKHGCVE